MSAVNIKFRTAREEGFIAGPPNKLPPAVVINPAATPLSLVVAINARVDQVGHSVSDWAAHTGEEGPASSLLLTVQEIEILLAALEADLRGAA